MTTDLETQIIAHHNATLGEVVELLATSGRVFALACDLDDAIHCHDRLAVLAHTADCLLALCRLCQGLGVAPSVLLADRLAQLSQPSATCPIDRFLRQIDEPGEHKDGAA
jgi:hypothetical protein